MTLRCFNRITFAEEVTDSTRFGGRFDDNQLATAFFRGRGLFLSSFSFLGFPLSLTGSAFRFSQCGMGRRGSHTEQIRATDRTYTFRTGGAILCIDRLGILHLPLGFAFDAVCEVCIAHPISFMVIDYSRNV